MICLLSRESRIRIEVILLATSFNSSLALSIAHSDVCILTTRLTGAPKHPRHYGRCDRDCKGSSGIWCEELILKSAEVVTNWTSSVNVSYPRMTADLLESQGDMYRAKTGGFLNCWLAAIAGRLATLKSYTLRRLYDARAKSPARPPMRKMAQCGV